MRPKDGFLSLCVYVCVCVKAAASVRGRNKAAWSSSSVCVLAALLAPPLSHTYIFIHSFIFSAVVCICQERPLSGTFQLKTLIMRSNGGRCNMTNNFSSWWRLRILNWQFQQLVFLMVLSGGTPRRSFTHRFRSRAMRAMFMNGFFLMDRVIPSHFRNSVFF